MLRVMVAVMFAAQPCIPHWSRVHTLVAQVRVRKQSFLPGLHVLLQQLQTQIHKLPELALTPCVPQELELLLMCW